MTEKNIEKQKGHPLFPTNPPLKKIWLEVQSTPLPSSPISRKGKKEAHYATQMQLKLLILMESLNKFH